MSLLSCILGSVLLGRLGCIRFCQCVALAGWSRRHCALLASASLWYNSAVSGFVLAVAADGSSR